MNKKYELTNEIIRYNSVKLYRIKALRDFGDVRNGDLGGFVESENNLSHDGNCWIYDNGKVLDCGLVSGNAKVLDHGEVVDQGLVMDNGEVRGNGRIFYRGIVKNNGVVSEHGVISGHGIVCNNGQVSGYAVVCGHAVVSDDAEIDGNAEIVGNAVVKSEKDYIVFKNNWSGGRYFTWTRSNNMWTVGSFEGTGEELIKKAYEDSDESGKNYERYVKFIEKNFLK